MRPIKITDTFYVYNDMPIGWRTGKGQPKWHNSLFNRWRNMWMRCRNPKHGKFKKYKDCAIDERYILLSNYVSDIMKLENFDKFSENPDIYDIDKDKIDPNNRCYYFEHLTILLTKDNLKESLSRNNHYKKAIKGVNIKDDSIIIFNSMKEANEHRFNKDILKKCLKGEREDYKGYKWYYLKEGDN